MGQFWWFVSVIHKETGQIIRKNVDGVQADKPSEAIKAAEARNPQRPHEQFGVTKAGNVTSCIRANMNRTKEIAELEEAMNAGTTD